MLTIVSQILKLSKLTIYFIELTTILHLINQMWPM